MTGFGWEYQHCHICSVARADILAGWKAQGEQLSNLARTITKDTDLDFAENQWSQRWAEKSLAIFLHQRKNIIILGSGEMEVKL